MTTVFPHIVDESKSTIGGLREFQQFGNGVTMSVLPPEYVEIGKRLERVRVGFSGLSQKAWAEKHGFSVTQYNNWEKGTRRIPVDAAESLSDRYGLTLDAIYRGRLDGLSEKALKVF